MNGIDKEKNEANENLSAISGFHSEEDENCVLVGYYAASSGHLLTSFRDNLPVASSRVFQDP